MLNSAGIVTFNPNIERLKENIISISKQVDKLFIIDNNSCNYHEISMLIEGKYDNILLIQNSENRGIAYALNRILELSEECNASWTLLLDQDSVVPSNIINCYNHYISIEKAAVLCPQIYDQNMGGQIVKKDGIEEIGICLTSGSYIRVSVWNKIGRFREELFIDSVDSEYSIRLYFKGFKTYRINEAVLNHELGKSQKKLYKSITNHNSTRRYYIARNSIAVANYYNRYLSKENFTRKQRRDLNVFFDWHISPFRTYLRQAQFILLVALYEKDKWNKIWSIVKGLKDGNRMKLHEL